MVPINLSDNLKLGERTLHLQTYFRLGEPSLVTTLFEHGQVLAKEQSQIQEGMDEITLKKWVSQQHQEFMELLSFLYAIDEKVRSVQHVQSLIYLGSLYLRWGLLAEAIRIFETALKIDFDSVEVAELLCETYIQHGDPEKANLLLVPFLESEPKQTPLWLKQGKANLLLKQYEEAFIDFKKSIRLAPNLSEAHLFFSLSCLQMVQNNLSNDEITSVKKGVRLCTVHLAEALKYSDQLSRKDLEPILQNLNANDIEQAINGISDIVNNLKVSVDLGFHQVFYLQFIYGNEGRKPNVIHQYLQKMESLIQRHPNHVQLKMNLGMGYVIQCRELYQKALHEFHAVRDLSKGQNLYEQQINEADRLGEQFFQFIKILFQ